MIQQHVTIAYLHSVLGVYVCVCVHACISTGDLILCDC